MEMKVGIGAQKEAIEVDITNPRPGERLAVN
jgi:hypothetical protein